TKLDKWLYFFKHAEKTQESDLAKIVGNDAVILEAYEALNRFSMDEVELNTYEQSEKRERDAQAILEQKLIEGRAEGRAEGRVEGRAEGRVEGRTEGVNVTLQAIQLFRKSYSIDAVHEETGVDKSVLQKLQASLFEEK
ncbi:MAG: PD-(D/E)XK nuclease family transposase, partial [Gammaproteobacteria bacterium]